MADTDSTPATQTPAKEKKKTTKPKKKPSHPPYHQMIKGAIESLKERGGSSRQAIQKYIGKTYKLKLDNVSGTQLKMALRRGVASGMLKQSKGTGASGSFRLGVSKGDEKKPKAKKAAKKSTAKKVRKPKSPRTTKPKKANVSKKAKKPKAARPVKKTAKKPKPAKKAAKAKKAKPSKKAKK